MDVVHAPDRPLRHVMREIHTRNVLYVVHDRWSARTLVGQRLRSIAAALNASASCDDDGVSAAQLYEHAGGRVRGLLKHRWRVERWHLDDERLVDRVEALRRTGEVVFLGWSLAYTFT